MNCETYVMWVQYLRCLYAKYKMVASSYRILKRLGTHKVYVYKKRKTNKFRSMYKRINWVKRIVCLILLLLIFHIIIYRKGLYNIYSVKVNNMRNM